MRWNQHSRHGMKSATSEKYRLPAIETAATRNAIHSAASSTDAIVSSSAGAGRGVPPGEDGHGEGGGAEASSDVNTCTASTSTAQ